MKHELTKDDVSKIKASVRSILSILMKLHVTTFIEVRLHAVVAVADGVDYRSYY